MLVRRRGTATGIISGTPSAATPVTIYVVTGSNSAGSVTASVMISVVSTGKCLPVDFLNTARALHTATLLPDGRVLVAGGLTMISFAVRPISATEVYVP